MIPLPGWKDILAADWRRVDWPRTVLLIVCILAIAAALWQYFMPQIRTVTTTEFKAVPQIRETVKLQRVTVQGPARLVTIDKQQVAEKLELPWLLESGDSLDPRPPVPGHASDLQVVATSDLPESRAGYQEVAVVNTATGETTLVAKEKELPWFRFVNKGQASLWYGYDQRLRNVGDLEGRWQFLQIKKAGLALRGNLETGGDAQLQAGIIYEW